MFNTLLDMENQQKARYKYEWDQVRGDAKDKIAHIAGMRSKYSVPDEKTGDIVTFFDDRPAETEIVVDVVTALRRIKRQFGDEYDVVIIDDDIYGWIYEAESDIIRNTGCNDTKLTVSSTSFPSDVPASVNIKRISIS